MSEFKGTPGEWRFHRYEAAKGRHRDPTVPGIVVNSEDKTVATVWNLLVGDNHQHTTEQLEANARLIAAAPELLKALQWSIQHSPYQGESEETEFLRFARAAIRKATGAA